MEEHDLPCKIHEPICIFGCNNSGTTILWEALRQHPGLSGPTVEGQDLTELPSVMRHFLGQATLRLWAHPDFKLCYYVTERDCTSEIARQVTAVYSRFQQPGKRLVMKSPADALRARLMQGIFPGAYFIAIVRNGYAVAEGIVRTRKSQAGLFTTVTQAAEHWFRANVIVVSHRQFLRRYLIIKYEDLVGETDATIGRILDFCKLAKEGFPTPRFEQGKNEEQIQRLTGYDIEVISRIAGPMLHHFGYDLIDPALRW